LPALGRPDLGVGLGGVDPAGHQGRHLVALEGDQGRHDDGRAGDDQGRELVDGRLARAGGEDGEDVAAAGGGPDGLLLAGAELLEAEGLAGQAPELAGVGRGQLIENWVEEVVDVAHAAGFLPRAAGV
jgi:hypothetical protein